MTPRLSEPPSETGRGVGERVTAAAQSLEANRPILIVGEEDGDFTGFLAQPANAADSRSIRFLADHGGGTLFAGLPAQRLHDLGIPVVATPNGSSASRDAAAQGPSVCVKGAIGDSSRDRAITLRALADPDSTRATWRMPGSVYPYGIHGRGVLGRASAFEAATDLAQLAGLPPVVALTRLMLDGALPDLEQIRDFAQLHSLHWLHVTDVLEHRASHRLRSSTEARMPTQFGSFRAVVYQDTASGREHVALVKGDLGEDRPVLCRVHSECLTGEVLGSLRCDCGPQLEAALRHIAEVGRGVLLYLRQEGRGIGLFNKMRCYALQDRGFDTVEANEKLGFVADARDYGVAAEILRDLGVASLDLLTNNPRKIAGVERHGIEVAQRVPLQIPPGPENGQYLETKRTKLGHLIQGGHPPHSASPSRDDEATSASRLGIRLHPPEPKGGDPDGPRRH